MLAGLEAFDATVRGWFEAVEEAAEKTAIALANEVFNKALEESPQFSGSYAANWRLTYGHLDKTFEFDPLGTKQQGNAAYQRGSAPAMAHARGKASGQTGFKLGQSIFVSNSTKSANEVTRGEFNASMFTDLAWKIEEGKIKFRPVNEGADHVAARSLNFVAHRYPTINKASLTTLIGLGV